MTSANFRNSKYCTEGSYTTQNLLRITLTMSWQHFPPKYFQISDKSMLEINSEMQSKSFTIFPLSTFSTHASENEYP